MINLEHADKVHGEGRFVAAAVLVILDYQRNTVDDLKSADIENAIVERLATSALGSMTDAPAPEVRAVIAKVYRNYRPGTENAKTAPLFFRPTNMLQIAFSSIAALKDEGMIAQVDDTAKMDAKPDPPPPKDLGQAEVPAKTTNAKQGGILGGKSKGGSKEKT